MPFNQLSISDLVFSYKRDLSFIDGFNLNCLPGQKTALIGANGSGKTTLFLLLSGLLRPQGGSIRIDEKEIKYNSFNPEISYLFQSPDDQLFTARVFDDVAFGPLNTGLSREDVLKQVNDALDRTGTTHLRDKAPHHLSGGEKRLAALATILSMEPEILLLDEPTSNLDALNRRNVINIINDLDTSMLISSHDLEFLLEVCSRCILIDKGSLICDGPTRDILADEKLLSKYNMEKPHSLIPHRHSSNIRGNVREH